MNPPFERLNGGCLHVDHADYAQAGSPNSDSRQTIRVARANFEKGKWQFSVGAASFSVDITDVSFQAKTGRGKFVFSRAIRSR